MLGLIPEHIWGCFQSRDNIQYADLSHPMQHLVAPLLVQRDVEDSAPLADGVAQEMTGFCASDQHVELCL